MQAIRVLLVDDEQEFVDVLSQRLRGRGLEVETAGNGLDALSLASQSRFDAVVLDLAMPGMDGIETLKQMVTQNPNLQVILLTGQGTLKSGVDAMHAGAMEFMTKPAKIDDLLSRIQTARTRTEQLTAQDIERSMQDIMNRRGW